MRFTARLAAIPASKWCSRKLTVNPIVRHLGRVDYAATYAAMQRFTQARSQDTPDEIWLCEHAPVFTQGVSGHNSHLLAPGSIPIIATDRGGQVTYHGPGQVMAYPLLDLARAGYFVKEYVYRLEEALIRTLAHWGVTGHRVQGAPGIYVRPDAPGAHAMLAQRPSHTNQGAGIQPNFAGLGKIAALGVKVSKRCTYHGLALNVAMDLEPFTRINPCGYAGLQTVDLSTIGVPLSWAQAADVLGQKLLSQLSP